ncbi:LysR family transcriptional regulator, partial [Kitasatospora phosalacinea]
RRPPAGPRAQDAAALLALSAAGHGLTVLPQSLAAAAGAGAGAAVLPVRVPRLVHRREVLFVPGLDGPARVFLDALPRGG